MEQEAARWLLTKLGYNSSADVTLSASCRGSLKGLWEFCIANYKTADSKRHIENVLVRHRREQEAARRLPEQQREAQERRNRLQQLRKRTAELQQTLTSFQTRTEVQVQEATDQGCEKSLLRHVLHSTQSQLVLLEAFTKRGRQLLPELQSRLSQLQSTLDYIQARCRSTGHTKAHDSVQQQVLMLSDSIRDGMHQAVQHALKQHCVPLGATDLQQQQDQHCSASGCLQLQGGEPTLDDSGSLQLASLGGQQQQQQQGSSLAEDGLQQLLQLCKLLQSFTLPAGVMGSALHLLQHAPGLLWGVCAQLAQQNLLELTARLDEAQRDMLAPLHWPGSRTHSSQQQQELLQYKPDQQHLVLYSSSGHRLPWASGLNMIITAAMQQQGLSLPPEVRVKMRLKDHVSLHVQTEQALQRIKAAQQELDEVLGSTPLLQATIAAVFDDHAAPAAAGAGSWQPQLAQLFLSAARLRAQVALMQQYEEQLGQELMQLQEIKAVTVDKELEVNQQMQEDYELNQLLHLATEDTMELAAALQVQQHTALQLLSMQLLPCEAATGEVARSAVGKPQHEIATVEKLPVLELAAPVQATGAHNAAATRGDDAGSSDSSSGGPNNPVLTRPTILRLQAAGRQLLLTGRATTGSKPLRGAGGGSSGLASLAGYDALTGAGSSTDSCGRFGDSAAVAALKGASLLDPLAPVRCPAGLLLEVAGLSKEAGQLQPCDEALSATSSAVAASSRVAADEAAHLHEKVAALRHHELQEVLPQLQRLLDEAQAGSAFARNALLADLRQYWEMPAMHLVPNCTYQGKNCSQWLQDIQHMSAVKRELSSQAKRPQLA